MKKSTLAYAKTFPESPISFWAGARWHAWKKSDVPSKQRRRPQRIPHPFLSQRKLWCQLVVHFNGVDLLFSMPAELDQFLDVLSCKVMPSGGSLEPRWRQIGRPKDHWLARLPKKAKDWKFRQELCRYLRECKTVADFRKFYANVPVQLEFPEVYSCYSDAARADLPAKLRNP